MNRLLLTIVLVLLAVTADAGQYVVNSLPVTIYQTDHSADTWDTVTLAGTRLDSDTSGVTFYNCSRWLLLLADDTLRFGTDSTVQITVTGSTPASVTGVYVYGGDNIYIKGGYIIHDPDNAESNSAYRASMAINNRQQGIFFENADSCMVDSVKEITVRGAAYASSGFVTGNPILSYAPKHLLIRNSRIFAHCMAYTDRSFYPATGIRVLNLDGSVLATDDYNVRIENCYIEAFAFSGIALSENTGSYVAQVYGDTIVIDKRNELYTTADGNTHHGTADAYAIIMSAPGGYDPCYIRKCHITAGDAYRGGRGVFIEGSEADGSSYSQIIIDSNYIHVHEGGDVQFQSDYGWWGCAVKARTHVYGLDISYNDIEFEADGSIVWGNWDESHYCSGIGLVLQLQDQWSGAAGTGYPPYRQYIHNNTIRCVDASTGGYLTGVLWDRYFVYDTTFLWQYNRVESEGINYRWLGYDYGDTHNMRLVGDTVKALRSSIGTGSWNYVFSPSYTQDAVNDADSIFIRDFVYEDSSGAAADIDTSVTFGFGSTVRNMKWERTLNLYVRGTNGLPVTNATVTATDNYGVLRLTGTSDSHGLVSDWVPYWYEAFTTTDSTAYNNYSLNANKAGDNVNQSFTVQWDNYTDTLDLPATLGDGTWSETTVTNAIIIRSGVIRSGVIR